MIKKTLVTLVLCLALSACSNSQFGGSGLLSAQHGLGNGSASINAGTTEQFVLRTLNRSSEGDPVDELDIAAAGGP